IDIHAALLTHDCSSLLVANHYGLVRGFEWPVLQENAGVAFELQLPGDTERLLLTRDCLITSSPRGQMTPDAQTPGLVVSEPLRPAMQRARGTARPYRLSFHRELEGWGVISAMAAREELLAVAAADHLGLFQTALHDGELTLSTCLWQVDLPCYVQWLAFNGDGRLLAGGYDPPTEDHHGDNWEATSGGCLNILSLQGNLLLQAPLPDTTAWGYGNDALALSPDGSRVFALDRF